MSSSSRTESTPGSGFNPIPGPTPTASDSGSGATSGPLSGLLVADFSRVLAGPYATMLLADLGADVIKVESPSGDDTRAWKPPVRGDESTYYLGVNRNKRSIALNLKNPGDLTLARRLAARADIVVENFRPGGLRKFGLDYPSVRRHNPAVIYASISGFGSGGGASLPGYDLIVQAMSGLMSLTGDPEGPPYRAGISVFDVMAGMHATIGILAALHHRDQTGQGQHVEVNLLSSALSGLVNQSSAYVAGGVVPFRMGNAHPSLFPYEPLPTADGDLIIAAGNDGQFRRLCQVLDIPELADDPRFAHTPDRTANREALRPLLVERLRRRPKKEWFELLIAAGVPCGPINTVDEGVLFAQDIGLDPVVTIGEGERAIPSVRHPISFSATRPAYRLPPPGLDEHGDRIRAWLRKLEDPTEEPAEDQAKKPEEEQSAGHEPARTTTPEPQSGKPQTVTPHSSTPDAPRGLAFPTSLGTSDADSIRLLGQNLATDLMGQVGFGELAFWLASGRRPTPEQVRVFEAVLVALADHGFTPTALAARLTYLSAPDSVQGALAAGLLGGGSRFLGVTEDCGRFLAEALAASGSSPDPADTGAWERIALEAVTKARQEGRRIPGLGHPVHKKQDPRTPILYAIAREAGCLGPHLRLLEAIGRVHPQVLGRTLPLNGAGVCGAALADLGLPVDLLRGFALLARTAGLLGHLAEEQRRPIGMDIYLAVDRNAVYLPPDPGTPDADAFDAFGTDRAPGGLR